MYGKKITTSLHFASFSLTTGNLRLLNQGNFYAFPSNTWHRVRTAFWKLLFVTSWTHNLRYEGRTEKKSIMVRMFPNRHIAVIYGQRLGDFINNPGSMTPTIKFRMAVCSLTPAFFKCTVAKYKSGHSWCLWILPELRKPSLNQSKLIIHLARQWLPSFPASPLPTLSGCYRYQI